MSRNYTRYLYGLSMAILIGFGVACSNDYYKPVGNSGLSAGKQDLQNCQRGDARECILVALQMGDGSRAWPFDLRACQLTTGRNAQGEADFGNCVPAWKHFDAYDPNAQRALIDKA